MSSYRPSQRPDRFSEPRTIEDHLAHIEALIRDNVDEEYVNEDQLVAAIVDHVNDIIRLALETTDGPRLGGPSEG